MDPLTQILIQQKMLQGQPQGQGMPGLMASHTQPDPMAPGAEIPIARPWDNNAPTSEGMNSWLDDRAPQRRGLPGDTPFVDPRLIDPNNSPLMSLEGMKRGNIKLASPHGTDYGGEDLTNLLRVMEAYKSGPK